jgi:hypothetical protein
MNYARPAVALNFAEKSRHSEEKTAVIILPESLVTCSTETLITTYQTARRYNTEDSNVNLLRHESLQHRARNNSADSAAGIVTTPGKGRPRNWGSILGKSKRRFYAPHNVQTCSEFHPACYSVGKKNGKAIPVTGRGGP